MIVSIYSPRGEDCSWVNAQAQYFPEFSAYLLQQISYQLCSPAKVVDENQILHLTYINLNSQVPFFFYPPNSAGQMPA